MDVRNVAAGTLLGLGVAVELASVVGVLAMPHIFDRLHFLGPASAVGAPLIAAGVVIKEALNHQGIEALVVAGLLLLLGPVLTHATGRAARVRQPAHGRVAPEEERGML